MERADITVNENSLIESIKEIIITSRKNIVRSVNTEMLSAYWNIGKLIVEDEQKNQERAQYGEQTLKTISKRLTAELGSGFSLTNLKAMRKFFLIYRKGQTLSDQLSWSHYCELLTISDNNKRSFYEKECVASKWSVRELKRQLDSSLYERLLLSRGKENKEEVKRLAEKGQEIEKPEDILKDPYVFEFVGLPENKPVMEADLEDALINHIEKFLLELGKGFMFVGRQQRITFDNEHYYADMVFYNKILRAYVIIELKTRKLLPAAAGQLNMYLNYYKAESMILMIMTLSVSFSVLINPLQRLNMYLKDLRTRFLLQNMFSIFQRRKRWKKKFKPSLKIGKRENKPALILHSL